jgi:hypothetical protein
MVGRGMSASSEADRTNTAFVLFLRPIPLPTIPLPVSSLARQYVGGTYWAQVLSSEKQRSRVLVETIPVLREISL